MKITEQSCQKGRYPDIYGMEAEKQPEWGENHQERNSLEGGESQLLGYEEV